MNDLIESALNSQIESDTGVPVLRDRQIISALRLAGFTAERMPDHKGLVVRKRKKGAKFSLNCTGVSNALVLAGLGFPLCRVEYSNFYDCPFVDNE